ncbi:MAG: type 1 glutamine amidotransferase [Clostridia bacterium]|nr:MAG: type 1 glutamine amidotransferase [Clostridia bacterium]
MRALVIQNIAIEGPGTLGPALERAGWQLEVRQMDRPGASLPQDLRPYQALVVLGGPMGADDHDQYPYLAVVKQTIREAVARGLPVLGICLGAQLIARALGAEVYRNPVQEIGWFTLRLTPAGRRSPLFAGLPEEFPVFQWHADTFDLPPGATHLASTPTCPNQAFALGARVFGLQFHLEVTQEMAKAWRQAYADDLPQGGGGQKRSGLRSLSEDSVRWQEFDAAAGRFLQNLAQLLRPLKGGAEGERVASRRHRYGARD